MSNMHLFGAVDCEFMFLYIDSNLNWTVRWIFT